MRACEIVTKSTLDYSLWLLQLSQIQELLLHEGYDMHILTDLASAVSNALGDLRLITGQEMDKIWRHYRPIFEDMMRVANLRAILDKRGSWKGLKGKNGMFMIIVPADYTNLDQNHWHKSCWI